MMKPEIRARRRLLASLAAAALLAACGGGVDPEEERDHGDEEVAIDTSGRLAVTESNATTLRINTDSYHCANHSAAFGSLDTVSFTGTGGKVLIDPTAVRVVAYNTGAGNVPAIGTNITQGGVTGVLLLAESHISIHTWPEFGYAAVDIFMCGSADPNLALQVLQQGLQTQDVQIHAVARG